jgi:hypothetical protein
MQYSSIENERASHILTPGSNLRAIAVSVRESKDIIGNNGYIYAAIAQHAAARPHRDLGPLAELALNVLVQRPRLRAALVELADVL